MNPIGTLQRWAICALTAVIIGGLFGGWMRTRGYKAGEAAGNTKVAALQTRYAQQSARAEAAAREQQQQADAADLQRVQALLREAQAQRDNLQSVAASTATRQREQDARTARARATDATAAAWLNQPVPATLKGDAHD